MNCNFCKFYNMDCKNPVVTYKFLDQHNWSINAAEDCSHFETDKAIVKLKNIDYDVSYALAVITLAIGVIEFRIPIFKSKYNDGYYSIFPGEKKSKKGVRHYNITILRRASTLSSGSIINQIKSIVTDLCLYCGDIREDIDILDDDFEGEFDDFIFTAKEFIDRFISEKLSSLREDG